MIKKIYVQSRIEDDVIKHISSRFRKSAIKLFVTAEDMFSDLNRVYDDSNKAEIFRKEFKNLQQVNKYKEFHIF
jgi:nucleoid-associated protein YejK